MVGVKTYLAFGFATYSAYHLCPLYELGDVVGRTVVAVLELPETPTTLV